MKKRISLLLILWQGLVFQQHAIPTFNKLHGAIKGIESIIIKRKYNGVFFSLGNLSSLVDPFEITDNNLSTSYKEYIKQLK